MSYYLKECVSFSALKKVGFREYGKKYFKDEFVQGSKLFISIYVDEETRKIGLYINNDYSLKKYVLADDYGEYEVYYKESDVKKELAIDDLYDFPKALFELISMGWVEIKNE